MYSWIISVLDVTCEKERISINDKLVPKVVNVKINYSASFKFFKTLSVPNDLTWLHQPSVLNVRDTKLTLKI